MKLESQLQNRLLLVAPDRLPDVRLFRRNVGSATLRGGYKVQFAIAGQCDLYGLVRGGLHFECELKGPKTAYGPKQRAWAAWCAEWGIPHIVLRALEEETVEATADRWCGELEMLIASKR